MSSEDSALPDRHNPLGQEDRLNRCCSVRVVVVSILYILSICIWATGTLEYRQLEDNFDHWTPTNGMVVGFNITRSTVQGSYGFEEAWVSQVALYCPLLRYMVNATGENITVRETSECFLSLHEAEALVGSELPIRYDPNFPAFFMEEEKYHDEMRHLRVLIASGVALSIIFGVILIRIFNTTANREDEDGREQLSGVDPKKREELIRSKLHFQKVSSNINLSGNSKNATLDENKKKTTDVEEEEEEVDEEMGDSTAAAKEPPKSDDESLSPTAPPRLSSLMKNTFGLNTATLFLSSWRRPAGVAECCICLTEYEAGEIICTPKTAECNHMFHEKCVKGWLMANHDDCPLCRCNILKE